MRQKLASSRVRGDQMASSLPLSALLPDMTLYSLTALTHRLSGASCGSTTSLSLFGDPRVGLLHDFPSHLAQFCDRTRRAYGDVETVARLITNLPYFVCFRPLDHQTAALSLMSSDAHGRFKFRLGLPAGPARGRFPLRACGRCMHGDDQSYGVAYWHRRHQLPGVLVCQTHGEPLLESQLRVDRRRRSMFVLPGDDAVFESAPTYDSEESVLHRLATLSADLLDHAPTFEYSSDQMRATYIHALKDRGMVTKNGLVRAREFLNWIRTSYASIARYPPYDRIFAAEHEEGLLRLVRKPRSDLDTLYHAVLIDALFGSWKLFCKTYAWEEALHSSSVETGAFSRKSVLPLDIGLAEFATQAIDGKRSFSTFCREMGLDFHTATRRLAAIGKVTIERRPKVLTRDLRISIVLALREGLPQREVARRFGLSRATVDRVCVETPELHEEWQRARFTRKRDAERERLQNYLILHPSATRTTARLNLASGYKWLQRHDKQWLESQLREAPRTTKPITKKSRRGRVNWVARDLECLKALKQLAATGQPVGPGERFCPSVVLRKLPRLSFLPRLERLPLSNEFVATLLAMHSVYRPPHVATAEGSVSRYKLSS